MNGGQSTRAWSFLGLRGAAAVRAFGPGKDTAGSEDENVAVGEFLFELAGEALLDFVEAGKKRDGDEDYDGFFAVADFDLEREVLV
jgi:hypothetical protein